MRAPAIAERLTAADFRARHGSLWARDLERDGDAYSADREHPHEVRRPRAEAVSDVPRREPARPVVPLLSLADGVSEQRHVARARERPHDRGLNIPLRHHAPLAGNVPYFALYRCEAHPAA